MSFGSSKIWLSAELPCSFRIHISRASGSVMLNISRAVRGRTVGWKSELTYQFTCRFFLTLQLKCLQLTGGTVYFLTNNFKIPLILNSFYWNLLILGPTQFWKSQKINAYLLLPNSKYFESTMSLLRYSIIWPSFRWLEWLGNVR